MTVHSVVGGARVAAHVAPGVGAGLWEMVSPSYPLQHVLAVLLPGCAEGLPGRRKEVKLLTPGQLGAGAPA